MLSRISEACLKLMTLVCVVHWVFGASCIQKVQLFRTVCLFRTVAVGREMLSGLFKVVVLVWFVYV
jgi:hypothetical protein